MFLSIIKDFNATYHSILTSQEIQNHDFLQISWKLCVFFFIKLWSKIIYLFTFQWLWDFAYFPISLPELNEKMTIFPPIGSNAPETSTLVSRTGENMFDWFLGTPSSSWSLSFLTPTWFDHLMISNPFLTENDSFTLNQFLGILVILGLSSFFNSFLINFPLSVTNIWCLRYSICHNFKTSCISILGIVLGEIAFMFFLILPPPFIQITLIYLESIWPYVFGIGLVVWAIFDSVNNPSSVHFFSKSANVSRPWISSDFGIPSSSNSGRRTYGSIFPKIFQFAFLLSFTEQACCFSYFGSLNLSSTSNFLDTYIFAASLSPLFLIISCLGFGIGSFLTLIIFNYFFTQLLYLAIWSSQWIVNFFFFISSPLNREEKKKIIKRNILSLFFSFSRIFSMGKEKKKSVQGFALSASSWTNSGNESQTIKRNSKENNFFKNKNFISLFNRFINWYEMSSPFYSWSFSSVNSSSIGVLNTVSRERFDTGNQKNKPISLATLLKLDKFLLTCLITFAFTTIPYYSFDYLFKEFINITPKDEILNNYNLRVNYTDYSSLLGSQLPDKSSTFNTDVSLYDRAHFMYGEWPTSFESLNYQGELFWTNLRDHRRQKRKRRSSWIKFKNLKSKIATSWKALKRNDSLSFDKKIDNFEIDKDESLQKLNSQENEFENISDSSIETNSTQSPREFVDKSKNSNFSKFSSRTENWDRSGKKKQDLDIKNRLKNDKTIFSKLFKVPSSITSTENIETSSNSNSLRESKLGFDSSSLNSEINPGNFLGSDHHKQNSRESLNETIKNLSSITFRDLSNAKVSTSYSYPKNWKKVITEKYYQNQIYKILLNSDLKNFLKREPLTQQLTSDQEKELDFLRMKMCHYFDTLRFYFKIKEKIKPYSDASENLNQGSALLSTINAKAGDNLHKELSKKPAVESLSNNFNKTSIEKEIRNQTNLDGPEFSLQKKKMNEASKIRLNDLPFQFKSMTSLNYHQRFKGSLKPIRELFQISLPNSISFDKSLFNEFNLNQNSFFHEELSKNTPYKRNVQLNELNWTLPFQRDQREKIYHFFGSNDPFYVGWDRNLRKFVLTSRFLSRSGSLHEQLWTAQTKTLPKSILEMDNWKNQVKQTSPSTKTRVSSKTSQILPYNEQNSEDYNWKDPLENSKFNEFERFPLDSSNESSIWENSINNQLNQRPSRDSQKWAYESTPYWTYTSWPFFRHQLTNSIERPYSVMYENYFNILNKNLKNFQNIDLNNIDKKSFSSLYTYSLTNPKKKKLVSQLPQNIYKSAMQPTSSQDIFGPFQQTFSWPGSSIFSREYFFQGDNWK